MKKKQRRYMPAEWQEHERTLMEWPVRDSLVWPENYQEVCEGYAEVAKAIAEFEPVTMIVNEDTRNDAKTLCGTEVEYLMIPHDDAWCRDNGPTFLLDPDERLFAVNWRFNAWGEKYPKYELDDRVAPAILASFQVPFISAPFVLEGGSIHVDGQGTLLTTEECLLNPNRNPHMAKSELEKQLNELLGLDIIIWLKQGLFGDETDGHIDNLACFAKPGVVLLQTCKDPSDPNYKISQESMRVLQTSVDALGKKIKIIEIPQPPIRMYEGERLTLSYLNFYFVNNGIILPIFGGDAQHTDQETIRILRNVFPNRRIKTVDGMKLIKEGGNVHCITQQIPKGIR